MLMMMRRADSWKTVLCGLMYANTPILGRQYAARAAGKLCMHAYAGALTHLLVGRLTGMRQHLLSSQWQSNLVQHANAETQRSATWSSSIAFGFTHCQINATQGAIHGESAFTSFRDMLSSSDLLPHVSDGWCSCKHHKESASTSSRHQSLALMDVLLMQTFTKGGNLFFKRSSSGAEAISTCATKLIPGTTAQTVYVQQRSLAHSSFRYRFVLMAGYPAAASAEASDAVSGSACWSRPCVTYVSIVWIPLMPHFGSYPFERGVLHLPRIFNRMGKREQPKCYLKVRWQRFCVRPEICIALFFTI